MEIFEARFAKKISSNQEEEFSEDGKEMGRREIELEKYLDDWSDFMHHWAGDSSVEIISTSSAPEEIREQVKSEVERAGIDLKNGKMYINPEFFGDLESDEKLVVPLHEFGHFLGLRELLLTKEGAHLWKKNEARNKKHQRYAILDNNFWDIQINNSVVDRAPVLGDSRRKIYVEKIFNERDFRNLPKHIQFIHALDCLGNIPGEDFEVADDVQEELERLENIKSKAGVSLLDYATAPQTSQEMRIRLQEKYLYPALDRLFEKDVENEKQKEGQDGSEQKQEGGGTQGEGESGKSQKGKSGEGDESGKSKKGSGKGGNKNKKNGNGGEKSKNSEEYFSEHYEKIKSKSPDIISPDNLDKAVEKYLKEKGKEKSTDELAEEAYAKAEGITMNELKEYQRFWQEVESITDPETDERVIEQLRKIFQKIINERKKERYVSKYPTREGEILAFPAKAVADIKSGIRDPEVWETVEKKRRPKEMYGDFDVTVLADRSISMTENEKYIEQRKAVALVLEVLKDFCDDLDKARKDLEYDLNVRTEVWSFGDENQVKILKPLSSELTEKQRVNVYKTLADTPGKKTYDFLTLEKIRDSISEEELEMLKNKKLKKFIIVMSDGESHGVDRVQEVLKDLRRKGVIVVGVGITESGEAIVDTYAPDGQVCQSPVDLPRVLGNLLEDQLKDL